MATTNVVPIDPQRNDDLQRERRATRTRMVFVFGAIAVGIGLIAAMGSVAVRLSNVALDRKPPTVELYIPPAGGGASMPVAFWQRYDAFHSDKDCRFTRGRRAQAARDRALKAPNSYAASVALDEAARFQAGRCVSMDDPAMLPKLPPLKRGTSER